MGDSYKGTAAEARAFDAYVRLGHASSLVRIRVERHLSDRGLTNSQFGVLDALFRTGPMNHTDLADALSLTKGNITLVVVNLERKALLTRVPDSEDGRRTIVSLTGAGKRLMKRLSPVHAQAVAGEFSGLSNSEQQELARLCGKLWTQSKRKPD